MLGLLLLTVVTTPTSASASAVDGAEVYADKCDTCHGDDGKAQTKLGEKYDIADFTTKAWRTKWPTKRIIEIVRDGKEDTKMKAFGEKVSGAEIEAVAKYVREMSR